MAESNGIGKKESVLFNVIKCSGLLLLFLAACSHNETTDCRKSPASVAYFISTLQKVQVKFRNGNSVLTRDTM